MKIENKFFAIVYVHIHIPSLTKLDFHQLFLFFSPKIYIQKKKKAVEDHLERERTDIHLEKKKKIYTE